VKRGFFSPFFLSYFFIESKVHLMRGESNTNRLLFLSFFSIPHNRPLSTRGEGRERKRRAKGGVCCGFTLGRNKIKNQNKVREKITRKKRREVGYPIKFIYIYL
jgi:hypothetical protein